MIEVKKIGEVTNLFGDDIAYAERWDFSKANMSHESRVNAITQIASVCYANPNAVNRESLYDRLAAESLGLPSSSFEFVPVYLDNVAYDKYLLDTAPLDVLPDTIKYSVVVQDGQGLITNYRALLNDVENGYFKNTILDHYNTLEECELMEDYCFVYKTKVDIATARQFIRHRVSWQELCVGANTQVTTNKGKKRIEDLYVEQLAGLPLPKVKTYDFLTETFTEALIKEVFETGTKEVFETVIQYGTDGKSKNIVSSRDHKFLTKDGWKVLSDLREGDFIALNGIPLYRNKDWLEKQKYYFLSQGIGLKGMAYALDVNHNTLKKWVHHHGLQYTPLEAASTFEVWNKGVTGEQSHSFGTTHSDETREKISHRLAKDLGTTNQGFGKRIRSFWEADFRRRKVMAKCESACKACGSVEDLRLDHIKPVSSHPELGFDEDNVQILCKLCHQDKTACEAKYGSTTIKYGRIRSITSLGEQPTYDLEVEHPDHNYVADGVVVHNSRRYVSGKKLAFEFYIDEEVELAISPDALSNYLKTALALYDEACKNGCKAEQARRLIPVGMYTILWSGWDPRTFQNMLDLRTDDHAQREIQLLAGAMKELKHG